MENYLRPLKEKVKYNFLYIIKAKNKYDIPKIYDAFADLNVYREIKENNGAIYLEIQSIKKIENIHVIINGYEIESINTYNLVDNWNDFEATKATREEKEILYGRLMQIKGEKKSKLPFVVIIFTLIFIVLWYFLKINIILYCACGYLCFVIIENAIKKTKVKKELLNLVDETWLICECDVVGTNTVICRSQDSSFVKLVFNLAQKDLCLRKNFSGLGIEIGNKTKLYIKGTSIPVEEEEEQIYDFNGSYIIIPNNFEIPKKVKVEIEKRKLKEKRKIEKIPVPIRKRIEGEEGVIKKNKDVKPEEVLEVEKPIEELSIEEKPSEEIPMQTVSEIVEDLKLEEPERRHKEKKVIIPVNEDDVVANLIEIIEADKKEQKKDNLPVQENTEEVPQEENFDKDTVEENNIEDNKEDTKESSDELLEKEVLEESGYLSEEDEKAYSKSLEKIYDKPLDKNILEESEAQPNEGEFDLTKDVNIVDIWQEEQEKHNEIDVVNDIEQ